MVTSMWNYIPFWNYFLENTIYCIMFCKYEYYLFKWLKRKKEKKAAIQNLSSYFIGSRRPPQEGTIYMPKMRN